MSNLRDFYPIHIDSLPNTSLERVVVVANQTARFALTANEVQNGDTVKQTDTNIMYFVIDDTNLDSETGYSVYTAGIASAVDWSGVSNIPSTFTPSSHTHGNITNDGKIGTTATLPIITGTDGVLQVGSFGTTIGTFCEGNDSRLSDSRTPLSHTHTASDVNLGTFSTDRIPNLDASKITSGIINIDRLPHGALERVIVVADQTARFALTSNDIQNGDTVKQTDTNIMYFVIDDTNLDSETGYSVYTAGIASAVDWSGVSNIPSTFTPSSHTHGNITNDGKIGTTATLPIITGTDGILQVGSFGTTAGTFCQGNDSRFSRVYNETFTASTSWTVNHNLGDYSIVVQCWNSNTADSVLLTPDSITRTSTNQVVISWGTKSVAGQVCITKCA